MSQEESVQDNEGVWKWCHLKNNRKSGCLIEQKGDLIQTGEGLAIFSRDELILFGFREQNQNENDKPTSANYKKAGPHDYGSSENEY